MKKYVIFASTVILSGLLIFAVLSGFAAFNPISVKDSHAEVAGEKSDEKVISVTGEGIVKVKPDIAYISLGVLTENPDGKTAQTENAKLMDSVIKEIKSLNIKDEDIKTISYNMYPQYEYDEKTRKQYITGYVVNNTIEVTVRDITMTGTVIDAAVKKGANLSSGIRFDISDKVGTYNKALKLAVETGKGKAQAIAEALGVNIDSPLSISESSTGGPIEKYAGYSIEAVRDQAAVVTPVESGELEIRATVNIIYSFKF